jgi:hypothetical protein
MRLRLDGMVNVQMSAEACVADYAVVHGHKEQGDTSVLTDFM